MPRLWTPRRTVRYTQPGPGAILNWSHPLTKGLKLAGLANRQGNIPNLVNNGKGTSGWYAKWGASRNNSLVAYNRNTTTGWVSWPTSVFSVDGWTALTVVVNVFQFSDSTSSYDPWVSTNTFNTGFFFGRNQSQRQQLYIEDQQLLDYSACYTEDTWVVHGATWSKADTYAAHFVNGVKVADDTDARWDITISTSDSVRLFAASSSSLFAKADIDYVYMWNRRLSETEMLQLFIDPYALFTFEKPMSRVKSVVVGGLSIPVAMNTYRQRRA